ncbi:MAG: acylphosphatase [Methanomicrobiales archaeon]|nr:acylphosphatase [Methanomicrobiales archaeon]
MTIKEEIIIEGSCVHNVGYRVHIINYARIHRIRHIFAFNQEKGGLQNVVIQIEDTNESITAFLEFLTLSQPAGAQVSRITHAPYEGPVDPLTEFRQDLILEQLSKGVPAILDIQKSMKDIRISNQEINASNKEINASNKEINASIKDIKTSNQNIEATQKEICAGQEVMIAKQDETITEVRGRSWKRPSKGRASWPDNRNLLATHFSEPFSAPHDHSFFMGVEKHGR